MSTTFRIREQPHFEVDSRMLARWLLDQGGDRWWSVDGDTFLSGLKAMPCTAEELAELLDRVDKPLLVHDPKERPTSRGQRLENVAQLDDLYLLLRDNERVAKGEAGPIWLDNRFFAFCWKSRDVTWLLIEDLESTEDFREVSTSGTSTD